MLKIHLDTDLGGDLDDLCALAMLLNWPEPVQLTGVTSVGDDHGRRAGYARAALNLAGHADVPVAAGADLSLGCYRWFLGLPPEERYWPEPVPPLDTPADQAIALLKQSIEQGATIVAIGPYTNLYLLDHAYPGLLARARLVMMGGWVFPTRPGYPDWGYDMDFNAQADLRSARYVFEHATCPTLVPLSVTVETFLRRSNLDALRHGGSPLAGLIAHQAVPFDEDEKIAERFGGTCPNLLDDIINFQHDPLATAVALGWSEGVEMQTLPLVVEEVDGWLVERVNPAGRPFRVVTKVDGARFSTEWVRIVNS
jgi:inosine-uridine nucleoside N-ribohydrolase